MIRGKTFVFRFEVCLHGSRNAMIFQRQLSVNSPSQSWNNKSQSITFTILAVLNNINLMKKIFKGVEECLKRIHL